MATRCDLNGIKTAIQTLLSGANTAAASPIDLSANLTRRVNKVLRVNPELIPTQASFYPYVTTYIDGKVIDIQGTDIAKDQLNSTRKANINVVVTGGVWNQNFTAVDEDPADEDINYLMENVELILRSSPNLGGVVKWQFPDDIEYYAGVLENKTHLRVGILRLKATVFY